MATLAAVLSTFAAIICCVVAVVMRGETLENTRHLKVHDQHLKVHNQHLTVIDQRIGLRPPKGFQDGRT